MRLSSYARGGYRRYLSWILNYLRYWIFRAFRSRGQLLVLISSFQHPYVRNLRHSMNRRVFFAPIPQWHLWGIRIPLRDVDIFHLHFIDEMGLNLEETNTFVTRLRAAGTKIVWTGHDLIPHDKDYALFEPLFAVWARAADGMIHHSRSGEEIMRARYNFRSDCEHTVIMEAYSRYHANLELRSHRTEIEQSYHLEPSPIRICIIGNPRTERKVVDFLEAVHRSSNQDLQVVCWSLKNSENVPIDDRISIAESWIFVEDDVISERLAMCDLLAIPVAPDGEMLTTGLVGDAIGMGLGNLLSSWNFLSETAGQVGIVCGDTIDEIANSLNHLTKADVERVKLASRQSRKHRHPDIACTQILGFYLRLKEK